MKVIIVLFSVFLFVGCEEFVNLDSQEDVPSCDLQFNKFEGCTLTQFDSIPCGGSFYGGKVLGERIAEYCGNLHLAPDFPKKCKQEGLDRYPETMKKILERSIARCT